MTVRPPDRSSPVPLYYQIAESLRADIEGGLLMPGDRLENELDLARRLGVSRPTVRQAIQRLVQHGLVSRRRGLGTVVVAPQIIRPLALTSLHDDLASAQRSPTTIVLSLQRVEADNQIAGVLAIPAGTPVLSIERLRCAGEAPLAILRNYVPAQLLPPHPDQELRDGGLYALLRRQGVQLQAAQQVLAARRATAREARLLQAPSGACVLTMTRTAFDRAGVPVEHGSHAYLADRYSFTMSLAAR